MIALERSFAALGTGRDLHGSPLFLEVEFQLTDLSLFLLVHAGLERRYAKRKQSPTTISRVRTIVATHREVATGALAVISIWRMMKVFSYSQYLLTWGWYISPQTVRFALNFTYLG